MTYVASPTYSEREDARRENLKQCLDTARRRLEETSRASDTEKQDLLIAGAVAAGWSEDEVRVVLEGLPHQSPDEEWVKTEPHQFGVFPSSSL